MPQSGGGLLRSISSLFGTQREGQDGATIEEELPTHNPVDYVPLKKQEEPKITVFKSNPTPPTKRKAIMPHRWHPEQGFLPLTRPDFPAWKKESKEIARQWPSSRKALHKKRFDSSGWKTPHKTQALEGRASKTELGEKMLKATDNKLERKYSGAPPSWVGGRRRKKRSRRRRRKVKRRKTKKR